MTAAVATEPAAAGAGRYSTVAILLHWLIAAAILLQVSLAWRMVGPHTPQSFALIQLHKSVGITILLLSFARLGWRLINPPSPLPMTMARWERGLSRIVHVGFYVIMISMPLTGWLIVSASRTQIPTLLFGVVPWPNIPGIGGLAPDAKKVWQTLGEQAHGTLALFLYALFVLHVGGALKHQLFSRDEPVLARMAPGAVAGRWLEPRLLAIVVAYVAISIFGRLVTPPVAGMAPRPVAAAAQAPAEAPAPTVAVKASVQAPAPATSPATPPTASALAAAPSGPAHWTVQPGSTLGFATSWSGQAITGRFDRWKADITFSPDALDRSKVTVTIDLASVNTGDPQRDATLPSSDWFDAAAHPKAVFTANRFENTGPDRYVAHGTLQLRGVSKPQDLAFRLKITGERAEVSGTASLDRTAFGVGQGEFAATDQVPGVVSVSVALKAKRD
ncbi:MAG: cytochrome [Phenylobacterium sp.]|nr:cytochrome [Phenylobacterium sp.]